MRDDVGTLEEMLDEAALPFSMLRQARIICDTLRRALACVRMTIASNQKLAAYRCFAASKPSPVFAPVTIMVLPVRSPLGTGMSPKSWPLSSCLISLKGGILIVRKDSWGIGYSVPGSDSTQMKGNSE